MTILEPFLPLSDLEVEMEGDRVAVVVLDMVDVDVSMDSRRRRGSFDDEVLGLMEGTVKGLCQRGSIGAAACVDQIVFVRAIKLLRQGKSTVKLPSSNTEVVVEQVIDCGGWWRWMMKEGKV